MILRVDCVPGSEDLWKDVLTEQYFGQEPDRIPPQRVHALTTPGIITFKLDLTKREEKKLRTTIKLYRAARIPHLAAFNSQLFLAKLTGKVSAEDAAKYHRELTRIKLTEIKGEPA